MPKIEDAEKLALSMISVGRQFGKKIGACLTSMVQPLGNAVGNALEVKEAIDTLHGKGPADFTGLVFETGAQLLSAAGLYSYEEAKKKMQENIDNGKAADLLSTMINHQCGDGRVVEDTSLLPQAEHVTAIQADRSGYIARISARTIGELSMALGAGRISKEDEIDYAAGIVLNKKVGDYAAKGDVLAYVHHNKPLKEGWIQRFMKAYSYSSEECAPVEIIKKVIW